MKSVVRAIVAIVVAGVVTVVLVVAVELFGAIVHPLPADFAGTHDEMCRHVERYPAWVLGVVVPAWAATAFAGGWTARRIGNVVSFAVVGLLIVAGVVFNVSMLPYPLWFKLACLVAVPGAILAAGRGITRRTTTGTA